MLVLLMGGIYEVCCRDGLGWIYKHTVFHDYPFRHSSNIKVIASTISKGAVLVLLIRGTCEASR
jgi:hypothetical protein